MFTQALGPPTLGDACSTRYELLGTLFEPGEYYKVRECRCIKTDAVFLAKRVELSWLNATAADEAMRRIMSREAFLLKQLRHPNLAGVVDAFFTDDAAWIITEHRPRTAFTLSDAVIRTERLPEATARRYFQDLVLGLRQMHLLGIPHRTIDWDACIIEKHASTGEETLRLSSYWCFGGDARHPLAVDVAHERRLSFRSFQTRNHLAPEVLRAHGDIVGNDGCAYDEMKADVWTCGVLLYLTLCGKHAFDDTRARGLYDKIARGYAAVTPSDVLSTGARDLLSRIFEADPAKRITLDEIIQHRWFRVGFDVGRLLERDRTDAAWQEVAAARKAIDADSLPMHGPVPVLILRDFAAEERARKQEEQLRRMWQPIDGIQLAERMLTLEQRTTVKRACSALLLRGVDASPAVRSVCAALEQMVPAFRQPVPLTPSIMGHAVVKLAEGQRGRVMTYMINVHPVLPLPGGEPLTYIEMLCGLGDAEICQTFLERLANVLHASNSAAGAPAAQAQ